MNQLRHRTVPRFFLLWLIGCAALPAVAAPPAFVAAKGSAIPFLMFGAFLALAVVGAAISVHLEAKRRAALQEVADRLGFDFSPGLPMGASLVAGGGLELFALGYSPRVSNLIQGTVEGVQINLFDYRYTTGSGKNRHTHLQTVLRFEMPGAVLPTFILRPENFFHKIGTAFGYQDIDFPTHPAFSAKYLLRGPEEPAIRQFFTPAALEFFEGQPQFCVEALGRHLILYRFHHRVKPENIPAFLETGLAVLSVFNLAQLALGADGRITVAAP